MADLGPRVASGVVMIAAAMGSLWAGGHVFNFFWLAAAIAIVWEWQRIVGGERERARFCYGAAGVVAAAAMTVNRAPELAILAIVGAAGLVAYVAGPGKRLWCGAGVLYAGVLLISVMVLRMSILLGFEAVLWLFAIVWSTDIGAYFGGRLIGGPKLWPAVSPSKTWAGFLTGTIVAALAGWGALSMTGGAAQIAVAPILLLGWITAALSQGGDLLESSVKRHYSVKDASHLIPGHGGVMDRLDGFIAAVVFAALVGTIRAGAVAAGHGLLNW